MLSPIKARCMRCGKWYDVTQKEQRYCSKRCKKKAAQARYMDRHPNSNMTKYRKKFRKMRTKMTPKTYRTVVGKIIRANRRAGRCG